MSAPFVLATPALAATPVAGFEAESMVLSSSLGRVNLDAKASAGKNLTIWSNGAAVKSLSTDKAADRLVVRVRGSYCSGSARVQVKVDGVQVLATSVATTYSDRTAAVKIPAGAHKISAALTNDYRGSSCDRNLFIDKISLTSEAAPVVVEPPVVEPPVVEPPVVEPPVSEPVQPPVTAPTSAPSIADLTASVKDGVATISYAKSGGAIQNLTWRTTGSGVHSGSVAQPDVASFTATLPAGTYTMYVRAANTIGADEDPVTITVPSGTLTPEPSGEAGPLTMKTGFESRNGSSWTTLAEEQTFLRDLDAASDRVSVSEIGRSVQGRPIQLVTVGAPRTKAEIAAGSSVLFVCTQHGNEQAGREACLKGARDFASTEGTTVLVVPTANPDGFAASTRHTATGADMNTDHHRLNQPETRALSAVLRDYKPDLLGDMHEYPWSDNKVLVGDPSNFHNNVDGQIEEAVATMIGSYVLPALRANGFATGYYPHSDSNEESKEQLLRQQATLRHIPTMLLETSTGGGMSNLARVKAHHVGLGAIVKMVGERTADLAARTAGAAQRAIAEGAAGNQRYWFTSPSLYSDTPPCGYRLTDAQYQSVARTLGLIGIAATPDNGYWNISMAQAAQPVIGLLLDSRSMREMTAASRLSC